MANPSAMNGAKIFAKMALNDRLLGIFSTSCRDNHRFDLGVATGRDKHNNHWINIAHAWLAASTVKLVNVAMFHVPSIPN